jgi:ATP-dependent protease ClpP protease subunit
MLNGFGGFGISELPRFRPEAIAFLERGGVYATANIRGGGEKSGLNFYNVLRGMPFELTVHNVGNVDSIGNAIFLAGAKRYACPHSTFMFHGVGFDIQSPTRLEEKFFRERLDGIDADQRRIGAIIEDRTQLSGEQVKGVRKTASDWTIGKPADFLRLLGNRVTAHRPR